MAEWQWVDASRRVVFRTNPDGSMESHSLNSPVIIEWMAEGGVPDPPPAMSRSDVFFYAMKQGVSLASTGTPTLNGTFAIDEAAQARITAEALYIQTTTVQGTARFTNGQTTKGWPDMVGIPHIFGLVDFINFAEAVAQYVDALSSWSTGAGGETPPSSLLAIP